MTTTKTQRTRIFKSGLAMLLLGAVLGMTGFMSAPAGAKTDSIKVTLCHRTNSVTNPYRVLTVSVDGSNGEFQGPDHTGHGGPAFDFSADPAVAYPPPHNGDQWGDIIPPYSWTGGSYPGMNWPAELDTPEEIAAFLATGCGGSTGCEINCNPATPAGRLTLRKVTAGPAQPAGISSTPFDFSVACVTDAGTVADTTPTLTPADPATDVATGLDNGDSCSVGETSTSSAFTTTYSVDGGSSQAGPVNVSFTDPEQVISVVVTNTYPCPQGQTPLEQGGCGSSGCVPTTANNQCRPCTTGTPNGQGGCTSNECQPTVGNNQCTPCTAGTPNGAGGCIIVTDACPDLAGTQASVAECPVVVQDNIVTPTPEPTKLPVEVEGVQLVTTPVAPTPVAAAQLPRTGTNTLPLAELGLGLVFLGAGALIYGREQTATV